MKIFPSISQTLCCSNAGLGNEFSLSCVASETLLSVLSSHPSLTPVDTFRCNSYNSKLTHNLRSAFCLPQRPRGTVKFSRKEAFGTAFEVETLLATRYVRVRSMPNKDFLIFSLPL